MDWQILFNFLSMFNTFILVLVIKRLIAVDKVALYTALRIQERIEEKK